MSNILKTIVFAIFFIFTAGLYAEEIISNAGKDIIDSEAININNRFVDLEKNFTKKSSDNKYSAIISKFNEQGLTKYEPGIITVRNENTGEEQMVEISDYHEAINDLIWTKHDILLIIARSSSIYRYICSYNPEKSKKVFDSYFYGDAISLSPDHLKIAFFKPLQRFMPPEEQSENVMISFDIRSQEPKEMHPSKEYDNRKHEYFNTLKWSADSKKLALLEKFDDNSALTIWHFDGEKVSDEIINDVETNQYYPISITKFDGKNINVEYRETQEQKNGSRKITNKKVKKNYVLKDN